MPSYYSIVDLSGSAGQTDFAFSFPYLDKAHIHVYIASVETTAFTFPSAQVVKLNTALVDPSTVRVRRITPINLPLIDYSNGSVLGEKDLDTETLQILYSQQEVADAAVDTLVLTLTNGLNWDALSHKIINVLNPTLAQDAATKAYVDASYAASPVGHALSAHNDVDPATDATAGDMLVADNGTPNKWKQFPIGTNLDTLEVDTSTTQKVRWRSLVSKLFQLLTTKGDLLVSTGATTQRKAAGTNNYELTADSSQADGLLWKDPSTNPLTQAYIQTQIENAAQATPFSPLINNLFEIWQRGTSVSVSGTSGIVADKWWLIHGDSSVGTLSRDTDVPTIGQTGILLNYSLKYEITTADAAIGATDYERFSTTMEGFLWRNLAQRIFTVSFWVKANVTGTYCFYVWNNYADVNNRTYLKEFTINSANTWEKKTITVPASPTGGAWNYGIGATGSAQGTVFGISLVNGSNYQGTNDTWNTPSGSWCWATSNQVNFAGTIGNIIRLAGFQIDVGSAAMPLRPVDVDKELVRCRRYYQKSFPYATAPAQNAGLAGAFHFPSPVGVSIATITPEIPFAPVMMPNNGNIATFYNPSAANAQVRNVTDAADCSATAHFQTNDHGTIASFTSSAATAAGEKLAVHWDFSPENGN